MSQAGRFCTIAALAGVNVFVFCSMSMMGFPVWAILGLGVIGLVFGMKVGSLQHERVIGALSGSAIAMFMLVGLVMSALGHVLEYFMRP